MRLTLYTDYSLRVLLYLANNEDKLVTISELANFYKISRNHLVKVVHNLGLKGTAYWAPTASPPAPLAPN